MTTDKKIRLRPKKIADAFDNYQWQTDLELVRLDAAPVLNTSFVHFLSLYLAELKYPSPQRKAFAIETPDGKHIGNCSYYDINERKSEAQLGIMIGDRNYWSRGYGTATVTTMLEYIFQKTKLNRVYLKTLATNIRAQKCFQKCGFTFHDYVNNDGYHFAVMEITRYEWQKLNPAAAND